MPVTPGSPYILTKLCTQCRMFMESAGTCELCCCTVGMSFSSLPFARNLLMSINRTHNMIVQGKFLLANGWILSYTDIFFKL